MLILVALVMSNLIANSLALEAVVWLTRTLKDNTYCSSF